MSTAISNFTFIGRTTTCELIVFNNAFSITTKLDKATMVASFGRNSANVQVLFNNNPLFKIVDVSIIAKYFNGDLTNHDLLNILGAYFTEVLVSVLYIIDIPHKNHVFSNFEDKIINGMAVREYNVLFNDNIIMTFKSIITPSNHLIMYRGSDKAPKVINTIKLADTTDNIDLLAKKYISTMVDVVSNRLVNFN
jgi:hypothetical protein